MCVLHLCFVICGVCLWVFVALDGAVCDYG